MQPVARALRLLTALARQRSALSLQELADLLGLPVSTVHRLVAVLQAEGYLVRSGRGKRYTLGPAVRGLVASMSSTTVSQVADPVMRRLNAQTHETVILVELVGSEAICFAIREGRRALRMYVELGSRLPLHAAASARVLLSGLDDEVARSLLEIHAPLERWTDDTTTDIDDVVKHLLLIRSRGYDICDNEMEDATWAVAAPLMDSSGSIRASISVVVPIVGADNAPQRDALTDAVVLAAREITEELGAPVKQGS